MHTLIDESDSESAELTATLSTLLTEFSRNFDDIYTLQLQQFSVTFHVYYHDIVPDTSYVE